MRFLIISGLSGAGKSRAAGILEDMNFYCVDNMPAVLIPRFAELCLATRGRYEYVALVTDIRGQKSFDDLFKALDEMQKMGCDYRILFIEASVDTIIRRYKETRRRHPLEQEAGDVEEFVRREKQLLSAVRERADFIVDTTEFSIGRLQSELYRLFVGKDETRSIDVSVMSFGFKYGIPTNADLVFDVRFLPNPFYIAELAPLSGLDEPVHKYIFGYSQTIEFVKKLEDMVEFLLPYYVEEGKHSLVIAIGCTGGHHRSVAIAEEIGGFIGTKGYHVDMSHRDIAKSAQ
jgi:Predicted P-loop-containing kinase